MNRKVLDNKSRWEKIGYLSVIVASILLLILCFVPMYYSVPNHPESSLVGTYVYMIACFEEFLWYPLISMALLLSSIGLGIYCLASKKLNKQVKIVFLVVAIISLCLAVSCFVTAAFNIPRCK